MRFRDYQIKFLARPPPKPMSAVTLTSWDELQKKLGDFTLTSKTGDIGKRQIIGIVGENGIGKTTFVKLLAGVEKPDKGKVDKELKVSYKPQYLKGDNDELVMIVLQNAIAKYDVQLIQPLQLTHLLNKPVNTLSGGELQRVAIAKCLAEDADLYLLDEPSAYLDIEQRLAFSKIVRDVADQRGVSILIVDHDLLFIDYVSDKIAVFEGIPTKEGLITGPFDMEEGMNKFLTELSITMRRDIESNRPRINKPGSRLDREQKQARKLYYG